MLYTNHSGGCAGADMMWENEGNKYGVTTIAYSFPGHHQDSKNPKVLTPDELDEGFKHILIADQTLHRNVKHMRSTYVRSLLSRNWYQVLNAEAIYAVGFFGDKERRTVKGGTGWAVQMALDNQKPVYFLEQATSRDWYTFSNPGWFGLLFSPPPKLPSNFAGIGTRELDANGEQAIRDVYHLTFEPKIE